MNKSKEQLEIKLLEIEIKLKEQELEQQKKLNEIALEVARSKAMAEIAYNKKHEARANFQRKKVCCEELL